MAPAASRARVDGSGVATASPVIVNELMPPPAVKSTLEYGPMVASVGVARKSMKLMLSLAGNTVPPAVVNDESECQSSKPPDQPLQMELPSWSTQAVWGYGNESPAPPTPSVATPGLGDCSEYTSVPLGPPL